jgi:carboxylate-amine ligase
VSESRLHLFEAFGIELEYMIVDAETLNVRPIADTILAAENGGEITSDVEFPDVTWSNELVRHVIELKTSQPARTLNGLADAMQSHVDRINQIARQSSARLLPTAVHPWMNPGQEMELWPHDNHVIYETFNRIFDCRGHGWANLQSMHINLPFANDDEFGRLHAAVRILLPLLPALAASSPVIDGKATGILDNRLEVYRTNARRIASVTGRVIPEPVFTQDDYDEKIFRPMYRDIAPYDPTGVLQQEFLNARGAIARFTRGAIEIRVLDLQECPAADLAIARSVIDVLKRLVAQTWCSTARQQAVPVAPLEQILLGTIRDGEASVIDDAEYLSMLGLEGARSMTAGQVWQRLMADPLDPALKPRGESHTALQTLLQEGTLARRMLRAMDDGASIQAVAKRLANGLEVGALFRSV